MICLFHRSEQGGLEEVGSNGLRASEVSGKQIQESKQGESPHGSNQGGSLDRVLPQQTTNVL